MDYHSLLSLFCLLYCPWFDMGTGHSGCLLGSTDTSQYAPHYSLSSSFPSDPISCWRLILYFPCHSPRNSHFSRSLGACYWRMALDAKIQELGEFTGVGQYEFQAVSVVRVRKHICTHILIQSYFYILSIYIFENHEFTLGPPVPVQHHGVHFSLASFLLSSFYLAMLGLHCFAWLPLAAFSRRSSCGARASCCGGFSCEAHVAPGAWASAVAVCVLGACGSRTLELGRNGCGTWAQLLQSMQDLSSRTRDRTCVLYLGRWILYLLYHQGGPFFLISNLFL